MTHSEPLPARPGFWELLTAFHSPGRRWPGALRAALALAIPGAIALLLGYDNEMLLIAAGGFAVIYGEGLPFRTRWRVMATAGALLAGSAMAGAFVGSVVFSHESHWWLLLAALFTTVVATIGAFVQNALRLPPPGSFFIVMVAGGSTMVARLGLNPVEVGAWALVGAASGITLGMLPALWNRHGPETSAVKTLEKAVADFLRSDRSVAKLHQAHSALSSAWYSLADAGVIGAGRILDESRRDLVERTMRGHITLATAGDREQEAEDLTDTPVYMDLSRRAIPHSRPSASYRLYRSMHRYSHATLTAAKVFLAALLCGVVGILFGLDRPDWAIVSALLILQWGPDRLPGTIRGLHRLLGSVVGIGLFAAFYAFDLGVWGLLLALAVCQFYAEIFVVRNYIFTVIFTTPLALMMGNALALPLGETLVSRTAEVLLSVIFAVAVLWLWPRDAKPRHHERLAELCNRAMGSLLGALLTKTPDGSLPERRDLQFELISERRAAQSLAQEFPEVAAERWGRHLELQYAGYEILDHCNAHPDRELSLGEIADLSARVRDQA
ncbi:FUSC family protein [Corynebacterium hylobatis]|uniref:FUSC family protein n=1 Tax=Corynebacterium hylobatis TaxID=1859290 RepID=A0A3S0HGI3_9CORY|nr:FUSC family protein [Corynebacterium hylobatis]RSZ62376.1 FUSC family protein [Corynebacterium hylobatis]